MNGFEHASVMTQEVVRALSPRSGGIYVDATLGGAGHACAILDESKPAGRLIGIDRDPRAVAHARARLEPYGERARVVHGRFGELRTLLAHFGLTRVSGLVADLGVSSPQLDDPQRGFAFAQEGPLDMRMDSSQGETALELIGRCSAEELADILFQLGEERRSRPIARAIRAAYDQGRLASTADLRRAVVSVLGPRRGRIDPATRTFQALRIAVNRELDQLSELLQALPDVLEVEGVAAIISFHSLEDRKVKRCFRGDKRWQPLTKRPLVAGDNEQRDNPRARSAKLRAARLLTTSADEEVRA